MVKLEHKYSYSLEHLPEHLFEAGKEVRLRVLLARLDFLERKINAFAPKQLIDDYDLVDECSLKTIQAALRLSAHVLAQDKDSRKNYFPFFRPSRSSHGCDGTAGRFTAFCAVLSIPESSTGTVIPGAID